MQQEILFALDNRLVYNPEVVKKFMSVLTIRLDRDSEMYNKLSAFLENTVQKLPDDDYDFIQELKRLNMLNLRTRLEFLEQTKTPETVVIAYLKKLYAEMNKQHFADAHSAELIEAENRMFTHLLEEARYNDELTELEGLNNLNLRLVLQCWVISPEYLHTPKNCEDLLECLSISNYQF